MIWIVGNNKTDKSINEEKEINKIENITKPIFDKEFKIKVLNDLKHNPIILQVI